MEAPDEKRIPIKMAAKRTGLSAHVLRAWEKRYGAVKPSRTASSRRLYSEADVQRLKMLSEAVRQGHSISRVVKLNEQVLAELMSEADPRINPSSEADAALESGGSDRVMIGKYLEAGLQAILEYDSAKLDRILIEIGLDLTPLVRIEQVIWPLMEKMGAMWHKGELRIGQEHMATNLLRAHLMTNLMGHRISPEAPRAIFGTLSGEPHELGLLMAATVAAAQGWRVIYLGVNLPAEEVAAAAKRMGAQLVGLSFIHSEEPQRVREEYRKLIRMLPERIKICIGGQGVDAYQLNHGERIVKRADSMEQAREILRSLRSEMPAEEPKAEPDFSNSVLEG